MQSPSERIVKNTMMLYMRQLFTLALGLYTTRLTLQLLGVTDFGIYAAVGGVTWLLNILSSVFTLGSQRFLTVELAKQDFNQMNLVYIASTNLQIVFSGVLILIGETIGLWFMLTQMTIPEDRLYIAFWVYQISLFGTFLDMLNVPNEAVVSSRENYSFVALMAVVVSILKFLFVVVLFFISWDKLLFYALALFMIQFMNRYINMRYCKRHYIEAHYRFIWDFALMRRMLKVSFWYGLYGIANTSFLHGVTLLLNLFFGPVVNAAYAVAVQIYSGFRMFCSHFQAASNTQIIRLYTIGELDRMTKLLSSVCKISFFLFFTMSLPFLFNAEFMLRIWLGDIPDRSVTFFILLTIFAYTDVFMLPLDWACLATGKVKHYYIAVSITLLVILPIAYLAFLLGSIPETIYIIAIIMSWIGLVLRLSILRKLISLNSILFLKQVVLRSLLVLSISLLVPALIHYYINANFVIILTDFILTYIVTTVIVYTLGFDESERMLVKNLLLACRNKIKKI